MISIYIKIIKNFRQPKTIINYNLLLQHFVKELDTHILNNNSNEISNALQIIQSKRKIKL